MADDKKCQLAGEDLRTLVGIAPDKCDNFDCSRNQKLTSLKGAPKQVKNVFDCSKCAITDLKGAPKQVKVFDCSNNRLRNLRGAPQKVEEFYCNFNDLSTLEGAPKRVKIFDCSSNDRFLDILTGCPEEVDTFNCSHCPLEDFMDAPKKVKHFICYHTKVTYESILDQPDFDTFYKNLKNWGKIESDIKIQRFLRDLQSMSKKNVKIDDAIEKIKVKYKI